VVVVGDIFLDTCVFGNVGRVSPKAPVPVFGARRDRPRAEPGGGIDYPDAIELANRACGLVVRRLGTSPSGRTTGRADPADLARLPRQGDEYAIDQVVGSDWVRAAGGRVILIALIPDHSTTRLARQAADLGRARAEALQ
jgi:bifunctional ADP-heptose synthase (sugar kinase/adenylyltransferase)